MSEKGSVSTKQSFFAGSSNFPWTGSSHFRPGNMGYFPDVAPASTRLDREGERLRRTAGSIPGPPALEADALSIGLWPGTSLIAKARDLGGLWARSRDLRL